MAEARSLFARYIDAYNRGALDELDPLVTADYVHRPNDAALTLAQFKRGAAWFRAAMPDFTIEILDIVGDGDRFAARYVGRGTHTGSLFSETPSGRTLTVYGASFYRLEGDRIAEDWEVVDKGDLRRRAGALPE